MVGVTQATQSTKPQGMSASASMDADAIMAVVVMATNPNHLPSREQHAHNPSRVLDAWMHV